MLWEIEGQLLEVQGCIERVLDIIASNSVRYSLDETSASKEYRFTDNELGDIGKVKISILPRNRTELYGYRPELPDDRWLVRYLPTHLPLTSFSQSLQSLLRVYAWQIEQNIFQLGAKELFQLAYSEEKIDYGWEKYGLGDLDRRKQAMAELQDWQKKLHNRKLSEFDDLLGVIESQVRGDGLVITKPGRGETGKISSSVVSSFLVSEEKPTRQTLIDQACLEWVNRDRGRYTREEFLQDFENKTGIFIPIDDFKRALRDAYKRELITKEKGRYRPKSAP